MKIPALRTVVGAAVLLSALVVGSTAHAAQLTARTGTLNVIAAVGEHDEEHHEEHVFASVMTGSGELVFDIGIVPAGLVTGDRVTVRLDGERVVSVEAADKSVMRASVRAAAISDGVRRVLVIVTSTVTPAATPDTTTNPIATTMNKVDTLVQQMSRGRVSLQTEVVSATIDTAECNTMGTNVTKALSAAQRNAAQYQHVVVYLPLSGCGFSGLGTFGGSQVMVLDFSPLVVLHELGHNLGLAHAGSMSCGTEAAPVPIVSNWAAVCERSEYGDRYSSMGALSAVSFNAPQLQDLGWLTREEIAVGTVGSYELSPLGGASGTRALMLEDPTGAGTYWFEYRTALNADLAIANPGQVQVRYKPKSVSSWPRVQTVLLNTAEYQNRYNKPGLSVPGASFLDYTGEVEVRLVSVGATAVVEVVRAAALSPLAVRNLTVSFDEFYMIYRFDEPSTGANVDHYEAVFVDAAGATHDDPWIPPKAVMESRFETPAPGLGTLRVTTVATDGRTETASMDVTVPQPPLEAPEVQTVAVAGGVRLSILSDLDGIQRYVVEASSPGYPTRVARTTNRRYTLTGLAARSVWRISVSVETRSGRSSAESLTVRPKPGGVELGKLRSGSAGMRTVTVVVPGARRSGFMTTVFSLADGSTKTVRSRIARSGRMRVVFSDHTVGVRIKVGRSPLTPVELTSA